MLRGHGDDPVAALRRLLDRALERPIDRLGRTAGEGDASALEADRVLNLLTRHLDCRLGLVTPAGGRMRVGELFLDPRLHRFCDLMRNGSRRLVVEVDHAAFALAWLS